MHKYRWLLGEVLLASFFLQLLGLVTPLLFQVVTDKVLTHRGYTTLDVLVFGLITVSVFEAVLGGLHTYVFSHTTDGSRSSSSERGIIEYPMSALLRNRQESLRER